MALSPIGELADITGAALNEQIQNERWYQENANTVTSGVGFLATVATWAATQPFGTEPIVQIAILIVGFLATVFGVSKTKNGVSKSQVAKIQERRAEIIGNTPLIPEGHPDKE